MPHEWWVPVGLTMLGMVAGSGVSIFMSGRAFGGYAKTIETLEEVVNSLRSEIAECVPRTEFTALVRDLHERRSELDRRLSGKVPTGELANLKERVDQFRGDMLREIGEIRSDQRAHALEVGRKIDAVTVSVTETIVRVFSTGGNKA